MGDYVQLHLDREQKTDREIRSRSAHAAWRAAVGRTAAAVRWAAGRARRRDIKMMSARLTIVSAWTGSLS
ncbi:hypothetical protein GCM10010245_67410 [Streptomyces spectabilis]|nr:hypothetical protein GCM10010245_67410 [Streptomyces spectabilis]